MDFGFQVFNAEAAQKALEAKMKAQKYAALVRYLSNKITTIDNQISEVKSALEKQHTIFQSECDSTEGQFLDTFDLKESSVWKPQYEIIINNMQRGVANMELKKTSAEQFQVYWEQQAEMWEARIYAGF